MEQQLHTKHGIYKVNVLQKAANEQNSQFLT